MGVMEVMALKEEALRRVPEGNEALGTGVGMK